MSWVRAAFVLPVALFISFLVIRVAFLESYTRKDPSRLAKVWPGHPASIMESGLSEIGNQAASGRSADPRLVHRLLAASAKAPLAAEPFLVRGVEAQLKGDRQLSLSAFLAAREREPRTVAVRYFLADHYLKSGQVGPGLEEISVLVRLVPQSLQNMAPFLSAFARSPGAAPQVKAVLQKHPQLEAVLLNGLAADATNLDLILQLWSGRGGEQAKLWQGLLLNQLVQAERYGLARETWARFTGINEDGRKLFDPEFNRPSLPPFGWVLTSGPAGVAEPEGGGRLHILYYGRDGIVLASQLINLEAGKYQLSMATKGAPSSPGSLHWKVSCLPSSSQLAILPIERPGPAAISFLVPPADCDAQRLELFGTAPEIPEQTDVTISEFRLEPEAGK